MKLKESHIPTIGIITGGIFFLLALAFESDALLIVGFVLMVAGSIMKIIDSIKQSLREQIKQAIKEYEEEKSQPSEIVENKK